MSTFAALPRSPRAGEQRESHIRARVEVDTSPQLSGDYVARHYVSPQFGQDATVKLFLLSVEPVERRQRQAQKRENDP